MKLRVIWALFRKDFLDSLKNYQVLLMVLTPIILSLVFSNIFQESKTKTLLPKIGVIGSPNQPIISRLSSEKFGVRISFFQTRDEMERKIIEGDIGFGLILPDGFSQQLKAGKKPRLTVVYPTDMPEFAVERMQTAFEKEIRLFCKQPIPSLPIDLQLQAIGGNHDTAHAFSGDLFPMLVLMAMGMVGFLGLPLSFVEEKEKRTLYALFLTPTSSNELIIGKSLFSIFLIVFTVLVMVILNNRWNGNILYFWTFTLLGAVLYIFIGLLVALFAENQGSVNAIGTTIFMLFQLIPNLSQTSDLLKSYSAVIPSTFIARGLKKALFLDLSKVDIQSDLLIVFSVALLAYLVLFLCLKYRRTKI